MAHKEDSGRDNYLPDGGGAKVPLMLVEQIANSLADDIIRGVYAPGQPLIEMTIPTMYDPSLAPAGHHIMGIFLQYAPYTLKDTTWDDEREAREAEQAAERVASATAGDRAEQLVARSGRAVLVLRQVPSALQDALRKRFERWAISAGASAPHDELRASEQPN